MAFVEFLEGISRADDNAGEWPLLKDLQKNNRPGLQTGAIVFIYQLLFTNYLHGLGVAVVATPIPVQVNVRMSLVAPAGS